MEKKIDLGREQMGKAIEEIGITGIHIDEGLIDEVRKVLLEKGYEAAELYVAQTTASEERDELERVLIICHRHKLSPALGAEVLQYLNKIESGLWGEVKPCIICGKEIKPEGGRDIGDKRLCLSCTEGLFDALKPKIQAQIEKGLSERIRG